MAESELAFEMSFDGLPISVNKYLAPAIAYRGGKAYPYMRETNEAKNFKTHYGNALKRRVKEVGWDKELTKDGHWYLDCDFAQRRIDEDSNNYLKILMDSLTDIVYMDDKNILPRINRVSYDTKNPSFKIRLTKTEYVGLFDNEEARQELINNQCVSCRFYREGACSILKSATTGRVVEEYNPRDNICFKFTKKKGK